MQMPKSGTQARASPIAWKHAPATHAGGRELGRARRSCSPWSSPDPRTGACRDLANDRAKAGAGGKRWEAFAAGERCYAGNRSVDSRSPGAGARSGSPRRPGSSWRPSVDRLPQRGAKQPSPSPIRSLHKSPNPVARRAPGWTPPTAWERQPARLLASGPGPTEQAARPAASRQSEQHRPDRQRGWCCPVSAAWAPGLQPLT